MNNELKVKSRFAFEGITTPKSVASYKLSNELPGAYRDILPDTDTLTNLLNQTSADDEADESAERDPAN